MASDFGLQLSVEKTKGMAVGQEVDVTPVQLSEGWQSGYCRSLLVPWF